MKTKRFKKVMAGLLSITMLASMASMASCNIKPDENLDFYEEVDPNRTQLYIGNFNGGYGFEWLKKAKNRFESENPDVQIMIDNGKDEYRSTMLRQNISTNRQDMYVVDDASYYVYIAENMIMDVTDVITEDGENSIESRLNTNMRNYYKTPEGKYYGLPFYQTFFHLTYDVDLFDEYFLWLNEDGTGFVNSLDEPRYPGLKGEEGTWDEGLPRTYSQFFMLMDKMVEYGITPITGTGKNKDWYYGQFLSSVVADYEGSDYAVTYSLDGTIKTIKNTDFTDAPVGTFSLPSDIYETKTVNMQNYQEVLKWRAGRYYAIKMAHDILANNFKYVKQDKFNSPAETHTGAHSTFLRSRYLNKPIAMLIEGGYWYNEAKLTMEEMAEEYGDEWHWENRRLGVMPIPKADDGSSASGRTLTSGATSMIFISKYTQKADLAKKFFKFIHTDESLREFTKTTGGHRPFNYTLNSDELSQLPYYVQKVEEVITDSDTVFIPSLPTNPALYTTFDPSTAGANFQAVINGSSHTLPFATFFDNRSFTAKQYFINLK